MKVRIQVVLEDDDGHILDSHDVFSFQRTHFQPEQVGLTLAEAKGTLHGLQTMVVHHQVDDYLREQRDAIRLGHHSKIVCELNVALNFRYRSKCVSQKARIFARALVRAAFDDIGWHGHGGTD